MKITIAKTKLWQNLTDIEKWPCEYCKYVKEFKKIGVCKRGDDLNYTNCGETER